MNVLFCLAIFSPTNRNKCLDFSGEMPSYPMAALNKSTITALEKPGGPRGSMLLQFFPEQRKNRALKRKKRSNSIMTDNTFQAFHALPQCELHFAGPVYYMCNTKMKTF